MRCMAVTCVGLAVLGCTDPPLPERLDEPDVAIPADCSNGTTALVVRGSVIDIVTGAPVVGASIDITEAFAPSISFPEAGCRIGHAISDDSGRFSIDVTQATSSPDIVFLVTGAGLAPTIADQSADCLLGCTSVELDIGAPTIEVATTWREELYGGGMAYALNRGLVAYTFHELDGSAAWHVVPYRSQDSALASSYRLAPGSEVRFLDDDRKRLTLDGRADTGPSGIALIGIEPNDASYYRVSGKRYMEEWYPVRVMAATGWIYLESDTLDKP